jgi:hypothetical protein
MPRPPKGREIEDTIAKAYDVDAVSKIDRSPADLPDLRLIEDTVAERTGSKSAVQELLEDRSPAIPETTDEILRVLYPPDSLICRAETVKNAITVALRNLSRAERFPWIVPNPMSAMYAIEASGERHRRCLANTGPRRFIVTDIDIKSLDKLGRPTPYFDLIRRWEKYGVTIQDAAAAIISYLAEYGPLVMVVYSGNVSLQAWFYCAGEDESLESRLRDFFESAVVLGADRLGWTRCQLFRMPGATHPGTKRRQTVHFFNPAAIQPTGKDTE